MSAAGLPRTLSIRTRLTVWYATSVLLVFLVFAFVLRTTVRAALRAEFTAGVTSTADAIRSFFRIEQLEYRDVNATIAHIASDVVFSDRVVEFVAPGGDVVYRAGPVAARGRAGVRDGNAGALLSPPVQLIALPLDTLLARRWVVRVYASAASLERSLSLIDSWLAVGIPVGFAIAGGVGWWLAGRGLRPVAAMADAAQRMADGRSGDVPQASWPDARRLPIDNPTDELGRLGSRFNAVLEQMDAVLVQQRRFLADAAHELRTPVARMLGSVDLAMLDPHDAPVQAAALTRVRADLNRTARLVDELLQLARADASDEVHLQHAYLDDVVVDAVHAWRPIAEQKSVTLILQTFDETPAQLDTIFFERLVGILLDNAIRYTPLRGEVRVAVSVVAGQPLVTVSDTGIGITADDRARVFERFFRGASARAMSPDGSGLGLPIARWIAHAHQASLELTARPGGGTIASVTLPSASAIVGAAPESSAV
jgi:two-component system, OmpR family, sensor kinase